MIVVERTEQDVEALTRCKVIPQPDERDYAGVVVTKPWGREVQIHNQGAVAIWRLTLWAMQETSMHCHPCKRTILMVESGKVTLQTLNGWYDLSPGDVAHVEAGAFHRSSTVGGAVILEVESPPIKHDLVRLYDRYGREGQGYERIA